MLLLLAGIVLIGCGESEDEVAIRQQMTAMWGENRVLDTVPEDAPVVKVENGTFVGCEYDGIAMFKGIPYAKAPVGQRRWKVAERVDSSEVVREALYFGKSAIQTLAESERASYYRQGEDCLTLNVWATADSAENRPVMVWIHGGSYGWGGTSDPLYDGQNFVKAHPEVVLVTVNYRLGIMGFLDLTQMEGGEQYKESGNLGLLDQVAALEWIHRNIRQFGGNPDEVSIFGESAGGGSVSLLPVMPRAKGLFRRVIAQSGSVALSSSRKECGLLIERVKKVTGAQTASQLMALSEEELMRYNQELNEFNCFPLRDGYILPTDPYKAYADGVAKDIDMLMGTNSDECRYWIGEMGGATTYKLALPVWYENILGELSDTERQQVEAFVDNRDDDRIWNITEFLNELMFRVPMLTMAENHSRAGGNTYVYYWSYPSALPERGACHAVELAYVLNNPQEQIYTGDNIDLALAKEAQQMWVNFAVTGNPSTATNAFPCYDADSRKCLRLDKTIGVESDLLGCQRALVAPLIPKQISTLYCNISLNVPSVWRYAACVLIPLLLLLIAGILLWRRKRGCKRHSF